jgi:hypothetical protein
MQVTIRNRMVLLAAIAALGCADIPSAPLVSPDAFANDARTPDKNGNVLEVTQSAIGFFESRRDYDWTLTKEVADIMDADEHGMFSIGSTSRVEIPQREVRWIDYKIVATRNDGSTKLTQGVRGEICVTNGNSSPTSGLAIVTVVQMKSGAGSFQEYKSANVNLGAHAVLEPGERWCYPYELTFPITSGALYRATARVTITPASGKGTLSATPSSETSFTIPTSSVEGAPVDANAVIIDGMDGLNTLTRSGPCAEYFYLYWCTSNTDELVWQASGSRTIMFVVDVHNNFGCGRDFDLTNTAVLVEGGSDATASGVKRTASATLHVTAPACPAAPDACTLTQGYWKQTKHLWPDEIVLGHIYRYWQFFTSGKMWQEILDTAPRGDAYIILGHQYIASTLNQANGARLPNAAVRTAYESAAHYFATPELQATTSRASLISWADLLASFNEGKQGVPHCK